MSETVGNIVNVPQRLDVDFYERARQSFVDSCKKTVGVIAGYEAGSVNHPGISDLDFIVVLTEEYQQEKGIERVFSQELKQLIGNGTVLKVDMPHFKNIRIIDDFPLNLLWGPAINVRDFRDEKYEIARILDWLPERVYRIHQLLRSEEIDATQTLQLLKSLSVSLDKLTNIVACEECNQFNLEVNQLRAGWFENNDSKNQLMATLENSLQVGVGALRIFSEYLFRQGLIVNNKGEGVGSDRPGLAIARGPKFVFGDHVSIEGDQLVLPWTYYHFFAAQSLVCTGYISERFRQSFTSQVTTQSVSAISRDLLDVVTRRMTHVEEVATFLRERGVRRGLLKHGWFM